jgi:hypothetical protein
MRVEIAASISPVVWGTVTSVTSLRNVGIDRSFFNHLDYADRVPP